MSGGLAGRLGAGLADMWGRVRACVGRREETMPEYGDGPICRPPKKALSHISEGRESLLTRTVVSGSSPLDEASVAEHNRYNDAKSRGGGARSQSLPSTDPTRDQNRASGDKQSGDDSSLTPALSSTPELSSSGTSMRPSLSHRGSQSLRQSMEEHRQSMESARSKSPPMSQSVHSGISWVPELPTPDDMAQRRRRRSSDMLGGPDAARRLSWEQRARLGMVDEDADPTAEDGAQDDRDGDRFSAYLTDQLLRAPFDAQKRVDAHDAKERRRLSMEQTQEAGPDA